VFQPGNCFDVELRRVRRLVGKRFLHLIYRWLRHPLISNTPRPAGDCVRCLTHPDLRVSRLDHGRWCYFRFCVTGPGTTLFRAELAMEYPHVVVQFMFRLVPSVALTTGGIGHLLSPYCEDIPQQLRGAARVSGLGALLSLLQFPFCDDADSQRSVYPGGSSSPVFQ
jgi:hypothetical protein